MNKIYLLIVFLLIFLFLVYYYRQYTVNQHITKVNERNKLTESFEDLERFDNNLPSNPTFIFETISGVIHIFKDNRYWRVVDNKITISNQYISKYWNIKNSFTIDNGYYDFPNFELILLSRNKIYTYNLLNNSLSKGTYIKEYYQGLTGLDETITKLFYFQEHIYLYTKKERCIVYDYLNDKIIQNNKYKNIPSNFSCAFIKYSHIDYQIPGGKLYFIKGYRYYIYNTHQQTLDENGVNFKLGFLKTSNKFEVPFNGTKVDFVSPKKAKYRIITVGAGNKSGGRGGLIYNDYILNKKERIEIIIGESGDRLPVKHKQVNGLEKNYNNLLPYVGSCSGSGGTFVYKNDELIQASGGGGGWSSEIIRAPQICNSVPYCLKKNGINTNIPSVVVPIKKLIIETLNSSKSKHRLVVTNFDINIKNYDVIDIDVIENPPKDIMKLRDTKYLYQTSYSEIGKNASLEFTFNHIITDYEIKLDFKTLSTNEVPYINTKLIIIDEQYRRLELTNYHNFYKIINSQNIINYFVKSKNIYQNSHKYIEDGNKTTSKISDVTKNQEYFSKLNPNDKPHMNNNILLKGGVGGGGHSLSDRTTNNVYCGGGGGYIGGKCCIPQHKLDFNFDYVGACGGSSYLQQLNLKSEYIKYLDNYFINDFNENQGMVIIYEILDLQKTGNVKDPQTIKKNKEKNKLLGNIPDNHNYFNKATTKNRNKYQDAFSSKTTRPNKNNDFKNIALDTTNFHIIKKDLELQKTSKVNFIKLKLKKNSMKNLKLLLKCSGECQFQTIFLNVSDARRKIVKNNKATETNLLELNHGMKNPSSQDIVKFHELLCRKEIYKFMNYLEIKDIKNETYQDNETTNIFSHQDKIYSTKNKQKNQIVIDIDLSQYNDYLYLLFKKPVSHENKLKIDCVSVQYNSDSDTSKDLDNQIHLLL